MLLAHPEDDWPTVIASLMAAADMADHFRQTHNSTRYGNGTLMAAALALAPPPAPPIADPRHLSALNTVITAIRTLTAPK